MIDISMIELSSSSSLLRPNINAGFLEAAMDKNA